MLKSWLDLLYQDRMVAAACNTMLRWEVGSWMFESDWSNARLEFTVVTLISVQSAFNLDMCWLMCISTSDDSTTTLHSVHVPVCIAEHHCYACSASCKHYIYHMSCFWWSLTSVSWWHGCASVTAAKQNVYLNKYFLCCITSALPLLVRHVRSWWDDLSYPLQQTPTSHTLMHI